MEKKKKVVNAKLEDKVSFTVTRKVKERVG